MIHVGTIFNKLPSPRKVLINENESGSNNMKNLAGKKVFLNTMKQIAKKKRHSIW